MLPEQPAHDDMDEDDNVSSKHFMLSDCMWLYGIQNMFHVEDQKLTISALNELWNLKGAYAWVS